MNIGARWVAILLLPLVLAACDSAEERAEGHFAKGMQLLAEGEPAKAQLEFRNTIQLEPSHVEARYQLAAYMRGRNNVRGAVGQYRSVIELDAGHVPARRELAEIMLLANQLEEADANISVAYAQTPDDPKVRAIKSSVDYKNGLTDAAVEMARGVIAEQPDSTTARLVLVAHHMDANRLPEALAEVDEGLEFDAEDLSLNVVRLGILEQQQDVDGLGEQLKRLVTYFPKADQFREALARWSIFTKDYDSAEAQYRAIAANNPDDYQKSLDVARFLNAVHGPERARAELVDLASKPNALVEYDLAIAALDLQDGEEAKAVARLDALVERAGETLGGYKARIERAKLHIRSEEWTQADALLAGVLRNDPKNEAALLLRASRYLAADEPELAIRDLRDALDVAPRNVQIALLLATAYQRNGNAELAQERLAQAVQISEYAPEVTLRYAQALLASEKYDIAESLINTALQRNGVNRDLLVAVGQIRLRKQDWRGAMQVAEQLRTLDPDDQVASRMEAAALLGQRRFVEGTDILEGLVAEDAQGDGSVVPFVRALIAGGDMDRAEAFLEGRLAENEDDATSLLLLASIDAAKGDLDKAEARLKRAIELQPENSGAYASLARIYNSQGREELVSETLAKGLESNAQDVSLRLTKAMQLEHDGRIDEAIELYAQLYRERPNSVVISNNFASLLADHRADDPEQLARAINIAKRFRSSDQPHLQDTYGWLLHLSGDSQAGSTYVLKAAEALAANPLVQYHAGVILDALGQRSQARARLLRALELGEQVPFARADAARAQLARIEVGDAAAETEGGGSTTQ